MNTFICIHGHFYQPPRENPWLETIEIQDSAYPYRDWNERVTGECYNPNTASRIMAGDRKIIDISNNYASMSFDVGPTLMSWMEARAPDVYTSILEADKKSLAVFNGHGAAIAQVYNHAIMPLMNARDKRTQVVWGRADFVHRFKREPEAMWLAETAVDIASLELFAEQGMKYTILAPSQAKRVREIGDPKAEWTDTPQASIDPKMPYLCRLPSGGEIVLFFYDGPVSHDVAFGDLLYSGERFAGRLMKSFRETDAAPQLVHIATDGETYGHHARYGDMALAYCLHSISKSDLAQLTVYGEYLERYPPTHEVEIIENSSWSCVHGVERWKSDCGCNSGRYGWNQKWRAPLRDALDWLRDELIAPYEEAMRAYADDPWALRDAYISVILDRTQETVDAFFTRHVTHALSRDEHTKLLMLLEMERHALLMYTSCGWFFDEVSGIETVQVLLYAARVIQLAKEALGRDLEEAFAQRLGKIPSNLPELGNAARVFDLYVKPSIVDFRRVAAQYAMSALFDNSFDEHVIYSYAASETSLDRIESHKWKMVLGKARLTSTIIHDERAMSFGFVHLGDHNVIGGVDLFDGEAKFKEMKTQMTKAFAKLNVADIVLGLDTHFGNHNYTIWHLFRNETRKVFLRITADVLKTIDTAYRQIYETNYPIMQAMREALMPLPPAYMTAVQYTIDHDLKRLLDSTEPLDTAALHMLYEEARKWNLSLDKAGLGYSAANRVNALMDTLALTPMNNEVIAELQTSLETMKLLGIDLNIWKAQNILFRMWRTLLPPMKRKAADETAAALWVSMFYRIADDMQIRLE